MNLPHLDHADAPPNRLIGWAPGLLSAILLAVAALFDWLTGEDMSFTLLYLAPVATTTWFIGRRAGLIFCALATGISLVIDLVDEPNNPDVVAALWSAAMRLGVYLTLCLFMSSIKKHATGPATPRMSLWAGAGIAGCCLLTLASDFVQHHESNHLLASAAHANRMMTAKVKEPLAELAGLVEDCERRSRPVLLGSRDPNGPSCVVIAHQGDVNDSPPSTPGDLNGGPGTTLATMYALDREPIKSPYVDFVWHQQRLKQFLENEAALNAPAAELASELAERTRQFAETADAWKTFPHGLTASGFTRRNDWPSYCMASLDEAVAAHELAATKRWARELAAAAFSLDDLHRWLGFLVNNHLTALDFQRRCEAQFIAAAEMQRDYLPQSTISQFPAGVLSLNGRDNYYEVERQAERLFSLPSDRPADPADEEHLTPGAMWMTPDVRRLLVQLEGALSADNRQTWETAAHTPYDHSYLVNMLFRANQAADADQLCQVLKKADAINPHAARSTLLGVLMYRGDSCAGLEWNDRFQEQLLNAANEIPATASDREAMQDAWRWTSQFYQSRSEYGATLTLRQALDQKKLDCVRATDMISTIFRNAGRSRIGHVRWCSETGGHFVAAYMRVEDEKLAPLLVDGLLSSGEPESWPDCYFHGHAWPPGFQDNVQPFAVELYVRGIDTYVWADGYIVRGPNAGWLTTAAIPYSSHHREQSTRKVFDGPYPDESAGLSQIGSR